MKQIPTLSLCNTIQYYATLQNTIQYYATLQNTMQYYATLQNTIQCDAICTLLSSHCLIMECYLVHPVIGLKPLSKATPWRASANHEKMTLLSWYAWPLNLPLSLLWHPMTDQISAISFDPTPWRTMTDECCTPCFEIAQHDIGHWLLLRI